MTKTRSVLTSLFASSSLLMALTGTACIDGNDDLEFEEVTSFGQQDVVVHNELVDDGASTLHTLRSGDTTYSVLLTPTGEQSLTVTWMVEHDGETIEHVVDYEVTTSPDRGLSLVEADPEAAAHAYADISTALAGTDIEARLVEGPIDLTAGLDVPNEGFRAGICPSWWAVVGACGVTILSLPFATVGGAITAGAFGPICAALWIQYNACH